MVCVRLISYGGLVLSSFCFNKMLQVRGALLSELLLEGRMDAAAEECEHVVNILKQVGGKAVRRT